MNTEPQPQDTGTEPDIFTNRRYQTALITAVLLTLATITITTLVIIIANGDDDAQSPDVASTLTALTAHLPPDALDYPLALAPDSPSTAAAPTCDQSRITGTIRDRDGAPTDAFAVAIWGDGVPHRVLPTGSAADHAPGVWSLTLDDLTDRRLYVQITADDRYLSAPITLLLSAGDCDHNAITVDFTQVAPLE